MKALHSVTARAVAEVIKRARQSQDLSQRDLAKLLNRPHSVVGMIESDQRQVNIPEFITIAEALNKDPIDLLKQILRARGSR